MIGTLSLCQVINVSHSLVYSGAVTARCSNPVQLSLPFGVDMLLFFHVGA